ncbi:hypothetical protein A4H97_22840 [Niastella yeongjuensis]|uniref:Uncharacterized protein n=1 Tax=Niastella yeongjuensis TaxID=354355 RepID=A0A1V9F7C5_9BACT|nr:hypothetical protein [Niastella yeongjuensis]OQP54323.1 hypothetical protein A4H97_22840 [Niastella yeongjuensis]SEP30210.1 hypothetical protein SAMN05660816_05141 [Niastella yeongjuensis]
MLDLLNTSAIPYSKPSRLIEKAATNPSVVIRAVFSEIFPGDLTEDLLPNWLQAAVSNRAGCYSESNSQAVLMEFYEWLLQLVEALYLLSENKCQDHPTHLTADQQANPMKVITGFFTVYTIEYARRELSDFLDAGISHDGNYSDGFTPWLAWMTYNHVTCLVEAAFQLYFNHAIQHTHLLIVDAMPIDNLCGD